MDRGAHFYQCDFQVHSPRDRQWVGADCVSEEERKQYAASLIRACRDKGLDAIAITDHHDLCFARYVRDAARTEMDSNGKPIVPERQIVVFPGIELTLNVPCQAILLWDATLPDDLFSLVLTALAITGAPAADAKTIETKRLSHITTLTMLRDELDKHAYLRNRYIILPNVSEGGPDTLLRSGNAAKYASMPCVGGCVDGTIAQHGTGNNNIVDGKASEYGNKRIAVFQTSDNRREDHSDLGSHSTWVKWAVPTAEALRQACLAQESRISHALPELPTVTITALSVSNSAFLGPVELEFNAQYSALIGGRGTGKSTILEYLRWGLCDQLPSPAPDDELPNYQVRRKSLIEKTLQTVNATVQVRFIVNGIAHIVRRNSKTDEVQLKVGDGEFAVCKEADVRTLLPIQAYSQKQLSNVSVRLDELSRFVEAPIRAELDDLEKQFERASAEMRQVYATLLRKRRLQRQLANDELQLTSLTEQAANVRASLSGLSDADSATLAAKAEYEKAEELRQIWLSDIEQTTEAVDNAASVLDTLPTETEIDDISLPEAATLGAIKKEVLQYIGTAKALIDDLKRRRANVISEVGEYAGALKTHWDSWGNALALFNERYEQAKGRATAHSSRSSSTSSMTILFAGTSWTTACTTRECPTDGRDAKYNDAGWNESAALAP
jgi:chromosome segregation protein